MTDEQYECPHCNKHHDPDEWCGARLDAFQKRIYKLEDHVCQVEKQYKDSQSEVDGSVIKLQCRVKEIEQFGERVWIRLDAITGEFGDEIGALGSLEKRLSALERARKRWEPAIHEQRELFKSDECCFLVSLKPTVSSLVKAGNRWTLKGSYGPVTVQQLGTAEKINLQLDLRGSGVVAAMKGDVTGRWAVMGEGVSVAGKIAGMGFHGAIRKDEVFEPVLRFHVGEIRRHENKQGGDE